MITIKQEVTKPSFKIGKGFYDTNNLFAYQPIKVITVQSTQDQYTDGDAIFNNVTPTEYYWGGRLLVSNSITFTDQIVDLTPEIATTDYEGNITRVSEGIAKFSFTDDGVTKTLEVDLTSITTNETTGQFDSVVAGTLAEHISQSIDSRIDTNMTVENNGLLFTTQDHTNSNYVRNPNFWGSDLDLTCISPWNSANGNHKAGTVVTPRHIINAAHYEYGVGTVVRFITNDGEVVNRTVVAKKRHPNYVPYFPDLTIYTLDSDLPASIKPCKVLASDVADYLTEANLIHTKPAGFGLDQEEKGLVRNLTRSDNIIGFSKPSGGARLNLYEDIILYDSGNPSFVVINDEPILLTVWTSGLGGSGTNISRYIADLNQMIVDADTQAGVSTGYTLTEVDLSMFPTVT